MILAQISEEQLSAVNRLLVEVDTMKFLVVALIIVAVIVGISFYQMGKAARTNAEALKTSSAGIVTANETTRDVVDNVNRQTDIVDKQTQTIDALKQVTAANTRQLTEMTQAYGTVSTALEKQTGNIAAQMELETKRHESSLGQIAGVSKAVADLQQTVGASNQELKVSVDKLIEMVTALTTRQTLTRDDLTPMMELLRAINQRVHTEIRIQSVTEERKTE